MRQQGYSGLKDCGVECMPMKGLQVESLLKWYHQLIIGCVSYLVWYVGCHNRPFQGSENSLHTCAGIAMPLFVSQVLALPSRLFYFRNIVLLMVLPCSSLLFSGDTTVHGMPCDFFFSGGSYW
jgi:hypothetical protein